MSGSSTRIESLWRLVDNRRRSVEEAQETGYLVRSPFCQNNARIRVPANGSDPFALATGFSVPQQLWRSSSSSTPIGLGFIAGTCRRDYARRSLAGHQASAHAELAHGTPVMNEIRRAGLQGSHVVVPRTRTFPNFNLRSIEPKGG
jgi:hypothetical protein